MALGDLFGGAQTTDAESAGDALTAGDYILVAQGDFDGAKLVVLGNVFGSDYANIEGGMQMTRPGFIAFRFCDSNVKVKLSGSGPGTSVTCGILSAG